MLEGFGIEFELMSSFEGVMSGEAFTFFILLLGAFSAVWTGTSISGERDRQTAEFLFTLPYSRSEIFLSKAAAHWLKITIIYLINTFAIFVFGSIFSEINDPAALLLLMLAGYFIALSFAGIGYIITVYLQSDRAALSLSIGIVLVSFLLKMLTGLNDSISWLSELSLFQIIEPKSIVLDHSMSWMGVLITLGIYVIGLAVGLITLKKQDI